MKKHAYLIMAHQDFRLLCKLVSKLDDSRNDIYIHVDKRATDFDPDQIRTNAARVYFVKRMKVNWGAYSQVRCELDLMRHAYDKGPYVYYHLLSGQDLPLKSQEDIHEFFSKNQGKEFLRATDICNMDKAIWDRIDYYWPLQEKIGRNKGKLVAIFSKIQEMLFCFQKKLKIHRIERVQGTYFKGANWFSITEDLVEYVLRQESQIEKLFRFTHCADEFFLQTVAMNSPLKENIENEYLREIDWKRGSPYTFRTEDFSMLKNSPALFARKFNSAIDEHIIDLICSL